MKTLPPIDMKVIEIEQVPIGAAYIPAISAVETDATNLHWVVCHPEGIEDGRWVQGVQTDCDVEVVADVRGVMGVPGPIFPVYVGPPAHWSFAPDM